MAKIGRNEQCPCRSGKKFKRCCALVEQQQATQPTPEQALKLTLMSGVKEIQADAVNKNQICRELGVFFFYATTDGDAWLMEMTDCDCVQVVEAGVVLEPPIDENSETIEINWSHQFEVSNKQVQLTAYADKAVTVITSAPAKQLSAAMRRIHKKFSREQLDKVHVSQEEVPTA